MPCTTILAGKNATFDGSTFMARNEDSPSKVFTPKKFIVVSEKEQPRHYKAVLSKFEMDLPDNPLRYTAVPNSNPKEGIWGEAGINSLNVAMSETETITSNARVQMADPCLEKEGIGEEDMLTIVLPYIKSAREGVERLGSLIEEYGTYEMNGIGFQDVNEVWWFETIGGHHWIAKRVPDDSYVVMPNQLGIDSFDFEDALKGKAENHMCSKDMIDFINDNNLDLSQDGSMTDFDVRAAFGSHDDSDHVYNTPRAWFMGRYLNPTTYKWDGADADYTPESDNIPWSFVPEHKITVEDVKYVLSAYYQGTDYDPYSKHNNAEKRGMYRPIGISRNNFLALTQLRPGKPKETMAIQWIAMGSNAFNAFVPFYANINSTPDYFNNTTDTVSTENFYWANRLIGALADAYYHQCSNHIERYQNAVAYKCGYSLNESDKAVEEMLSKAKKPSSAKISEKLEKYNQKVADIAKEETDKVLDKVLYEASCKMKNSFARSDA
ncbi:MAG: C69 family dipeptidase [Butyrivibrio sp.]|nr:C69 family dipeptidase [Butyrivibrio sp.]